MNKYLPNIGRQTLKTITGKLKKGVTRADKKVPIWISPRTFVLFVGVTAAASLGTPGNIIGTVAMAAGNVTVHSSRRYLQDAAGKPKFLAGHYDWASVDPNSFIDQPSRYTDMINIGTPYKINYIRISLGVNRFTVSTNPQSWNGQPTPTAFRYVANKADLDQWDPKFWAGLRYHCDLARQKGMVVHIALFDGVGLRGGSLQYRWRGSYWNIDNQTRNFFGDLDKDNDGSADEDGEFYRLSDFNNNMGVGKYQRKLIDKATAETSQYENVFYEVGNELFGGPADWHTAVVNYVKTKTSKAVTQNQGSRATNIDGWSQHKAGTPSAVKNNVAAIVGKGYPAWEDPDGPSLQSGTPDDLRHASWYSFVGGAAGWGGFTLDFWNEILNTATLSYYQHLATFIENSGVKFWEMVPQHSLVSNSSENSVLAKSGSEYVVYVLDDATVTLNLSAVSGNTTACAYDPQAGKWGSVTTVLGGGTRTFTRPAGTNDWVLYVKVGCTAH